MAKGANSDNVHMEKQIKQMPSTDNFSTTAPPISHRHARKDETVAHSHHAPRSHGGRRRKTRNKHDAHRTDHGERRKQDDGFAKRTAGKLFWALSAMIVLVPLPLASNRPLAYGILALYVGVLLVLWGLKSAYDGQAITVKWRRSRFYAIGFFALLSWLLLQVSGITPPEWAHPLLPAGFETIALKPLAAQDNIMRLSAYAGIFWLALHICRRPYNARRLIWVVALASAGYAAYGLVAFFSGSDYILWMEKWAYQGWLTSTFVNRNSFAAYAGIGLTCVCALLLDKIDRHQLQPRSASPKIRAGLDRWLVQYFSMLDRTAWGLVFAGMLLLTALLLTGSRGGLVSTMIGTLVLLAVWLRRRLKRRAIVLGTIVGLLALSMTIGFLFGGKVFERFMTLDERAGLRSEIHAFSLEQAKQRPLLGAGLGAFASIYRAERDDSFGPGPWVYFHAHNSYLQFAIEAGLPGLAILLVMVGRAYLQCGAGVAHRRQAALAPAAAVGAMSVVGIHCLIDFSAEIPAIAATLSALAGAGVAQSWSYAKNGAADAQEQ